MIGNKLCVARFFALNTAFFPEMLYDPGEGFELKNRESGRSTFDLSKE
jgi:hypothetical protein